MRRTFIPIVQPIMGLFLCWLIGLPWIAPAQSTKDDVHDFATLRADVQRLAQELLGCRAELIEWKMHVIRTEVQQVQAERQRFASERQQIEREIGQLNLSSTNEPGLEEADRREELSNVHLPAVRDGEHITSKREAALVAALAAENARLIEIRNQLKHNAPEVTIDPNRK